MGELLHVFYILYVFVVSYEDPLPFRPFSSSEGVGNIPISLSTPPGHQEFFPPFPKEDANMNDEPLLISHHPLLMLFSMPKHFWDVDGDWLPQLVFCFGQGFLTVAQARRVRLRPDPLNRRTRTGITFLNKAMLRLCAENPKGGHHQYHSRRATSVPPVSF